MENTKKRQDKKLSVKILGILLSFCLIVAMLPPVSAAAEENDRKLKNGSFEEGQTFTKDYLQTPTVANWNTTAFQGQFELFRDNRNTYLTNPNVRLKPTDGTYAAELNADEESTLYQVVKTTASSVYEWGLDHGARNGKDIMALVIGPNQPYKPSKPTKEGRDQFMQMVDWLNIGNEVTAGAEPKQYTVYSKKFADRGAFADNAGNNAFSLTPSTIYTEEWHIWIMASERGKDTSKPNPWNSYGSNAAGSAGSSDGSGSTTVDLSKYYLYTVPAGQTKTLFGFVSVGYVDSPTTADKAKTYGNFLDRINFQLYHPLSGSTTTHGSAVVGGSDGTSGGTGGSSEGHKVTVNDKLATYVTDGEKLKIQAIVKKADADVGCEFVGVSDTTQDESGNPKTVFLQLAGNVIEDTGSLTDEQKKGKWIKSTNTDGDTIYTYYLENLTSATDLHFVFIKNPTITYDPNGGKDYVVERIYNTNEAPNVYSFKPAVLTGNTGGVDTTTGATNKPTELFIPPCVSHAAEGQNDGWKFMGWLLTGDKLEKTGEAETHVNADQLGKLILPDVHTIACNYSVGGATEETAAQHFNIYNGNVSLTKILNITGNEVDGVTWKDNGEERAYANDHKGLTMIAQWRWRQSFIPQVGSGANYTDSANGGTVEITSVTNTSDSNYNAAYNANGGKSYHAETDETITATATAKDGFTFEGWYDASGKLITTNTTYSYTETKESVNTYYARFSGSVTQTYIRQVKNGDTWVDTTDDKIGTLGRYEYIDAPGTPISSTAAAGSGYKFVGWYDSTGNKVADTMLINDGATISYTTTGNATYYARFETAYTVKFAAQTKQADGSFKTDTVGGTVSVASVTDLDGTAASSTATANSGYKFLGWYDKDSNQLSTNATYSTTTTSATNGVTYYARFEIVYNPTVESQVYLSFVAESEGTQIPSAFDGRDAGTGKNTNDYGLDNKFGNTIATGFKYSLNTMTDVSTIQITVTVPASAYVKVGGTGSFTG
ncbi:MAG: InlB B-repeat-containing protein, partial [Candidatus Faecousia sp.]|nr:InlB B-repeat-containing protein [Candidatus Faecousia sp.]